MVTFKRYHRRPYICIYNVTRSRNAFYAARTLVTFCQQSDKTINLPDAKDDSDLCYCTFNTLPSINQTRTRSSGQFIVLGFVISSRIFAFPFVSRPDTLRTMRPMSSDLPGRRCIVAIEIAKVRKIRSSFQSLYRERDKSLSRRPDVEIYLMRNSGHRADLMAPAPPDLHC